MRLETVGRCAVLIRPLRRMLRDRATGGYTLETVGLKLQTVVFLHDEPGLNLPVSVGVTLKCGFAEATIQARRSDGHR